MITIGCLPRPQSRPPVQLVNDSTQNPDPPEAVLQCQGRISVWFFVASSRPSGAPRIRNDAQRAAASSLQASTQCCTTGCRLLYCVYYTVCLRGAHCTEAGGVDPPAKGHRTPPPLIWTMPAMSPAESTSRRRDCTLTATLQTRPSDFDREFVIRYSAIADLMQDIRSVCCCAPLRHGLCCRWCLTARCRRWRQDDHNDELLSMAMQDGLTNISGVRALRCVAQRSRRQPHPEPGQHCTVTHARCSWR